MESVGRLAGGVAHDFNNMLGVILGRADLGLLRVEPASPVHDDLLEIRKAAERSAGLTRQLLAFARRQTVAPKVLDLNATVEGLLKMMRRLIGEDIDLVWRPEARLWPVRMDASQVDQLLANLCVNARDAIAGVGRLTIETRNAVLDRGDDALAEVAPGDYVMLGVSDDGQGMAEDVLPHIFEPFFTTKEGKGTGLGLATVYGIVKQNEGAIRVSSQPGRGSTFTIYLPRYLGAEARPAEKAAAPAETGGHETILLVEDEGASLRVARHILESLGYTVLAAGTPREALRIAEERAGEIQLLLTDVIMPEMNGRDLAERLLARSPALKCLFVSGYTADVIAHRNVLSQGVHFLQKPFGTSELAAKVREALAGPAARG